jgi:hypothetical protein
MKAPMTHFRCTPIPTDTAARWRETGRDDRGAALIRRIAEGPGFPCRHCLTLAEAGDAMLLGSYAVPKPQGVYAAPSPIFLHEKPCPAFAAQDALAPIVDANSLVSLRSYDEAGMCLYDLGVVLPGDAAGPALARALADPRAAHVNIHTARPGCLLTIVEKISGTSAGGSRHSPAHGA